MDQPGGVFVYGTLKRGQVRERCWPRRPLAVDPATVLGALYDLGPYPALVAGSDRVGGEVWRFGAEDMEATLAALDEVEGYNGDGNDWYRRVVIECHTASGVVQAWTYLYARMYELQVSRRIGGDSSGVCHWPT